MDFDSIVIGAGVVGLAVARALACSGRDVIVLECHAGIGEETSSRNSEVIHAGIYYPKGSLKAQMCVKGKKLLYDYCISHSVQHECLGKLIVASDASQIPALEQVMLKGLANDVDDLHMVYKNELTELEPSLRAFQAISSPSTGIINSHELMIALQGDIEHADGMVCLNSPVEKVVKFEDGYEIFVGGDEPTTVTSKELINSAGLSARKVSLSIDALNAETVPPSYLSKGSYFTLSRKNPFSHLIYPLPNNEGLGVHLTVDLQGCARFGPDTQWIDKIDYHVDPARGNTFYDAIRAYYPDLQDGDLQPGYSGIRPKISGPEEMAGDFVIQDKNTHLLPGFIALYGIESPGLTSCLAIAEQVLEKLDKAATLASIH